MTLTSANVARFLGQRALEQPHAMAVMAPGDRDTEENILYEEITFAGLHAQSEQIAHGFVKKGITRGMRTLLMVRPGSDLIRCCFALFKIGAVPVVIDPGMGMKNFLSCVRRTRPEALVGVPLAQNVRRFSRRAFNNTHHSVTVGKGFSRWYSRFPDQDFPISEPGPDELAAILFTSGSTGAPKGVCYGHGQFDAQVRLVRDTFRIEPGEVDLPMLPIFALFNPALGTTTVVPEIDPSRPATADPAKIIQAIEQCGITNSFGSPVLWKKISAYAQKSGKVLPGMRRILMAGAPVPPELVEQLQPVFPNARLWSPYGATECLPVSCIDGETILEKSSDKTTSGAGTCVGLPVAGVEIRIIPIQFAMIRSLRDTEEMPTGEIGEIIATGPSVTKSYDGLKYATRRAKIRDADGRVWHRMGDAGYLDEEGRLWFCGRIAERLVTAEGPLYTDCCEGILNAMNGIARSALIGIGKPPEQLPAIVVEPEEGTELTEDDVLEYAAVFPATRMIQRVFFSREFPVDVRHNAKINRLTLAQQFQGK